MAIFDKSRISTKVEIEALAGGDRRVFVHVSVDGEWIGRALVMSNTASVVERFVEGEPLGSFYAKNSEKGG